MRVLSHTLALVGLALTLPLQAQTVRTGGTTVKDIAGITPPTSIPVGTCVQNPTGLCIPLDASFTPVPFTNGAAPCYRNDDGSVELPIGFAFDFFGTDWNDLFVNNNGNVSFGAGFGAYSPFGFPLDNFPMIAPFWGDVDTRADADGAGVVYYRSETLANDGVNRFTVIWDHVGYYNLRTELQSTFQVILTDGLDPFVGIGNNICFCYDDMQWTTGEASLGVDGFGGSPATVGANKGDGVEFFQIGLFDHEGVDYDGPDGNIDGVSFLDDTNPCFSTFGDTNVPPIAIGLPDGNSIKTFVGIPTAFSIDFIGPEGGQTVTAIVNDGGLANFTSVVTAGNPATVSGTFTPDGTQDAQSFVVTIVATDDGSPPLSTTVDISFDVCCAEAVNVVRTGTDNAQTYASTTPPVLGTLWSATVDGPCAAIFWAVAPEFNGGCLIPGVDAGATAIGDLLVNPAALWTPLVASVNPLFPDPTTGVTTINIPIPDLMHHCGETWCTQCVCVNIDPTTGQLLFTLTNAIDVTFGF